MENQAIEDPLFTLPFVPPGSIPYNFPCAYCGKQIYSHTDADLDIPWLKAKVEAIAKITICQSCETDMGLKYSRQQKFKRELEWMRICPKDFQTTDPLKLPIPAKLGKVLDWKFNALGLVLYGASGKGKSRCAWKLMEREFLVGRSIAIMNYKFGEEYAAKMRVSPVECAVWLEEKRDAAILLLDDVLKIKLTDSAETALYATIVDRCESGKPMIFTLNDSGASLLQRMSEDRGPAFIRRIREYCKPISF